MDGAATPERVKLIHSAQIRLGGLTIEPAQRSIWDEEARSVVLEPRVMQVLVALARSPNTIYSRDELVSSCWDTAAVSDDAVNRVISLLRRELSQFPNSGVSIETITKVGYRLVVDEAAANVPADRPRLFGGGRRAAVGAGLAALLLVFVVALSIGRSWSGGDRSKWADTLAVEVSAVPSSANDSRSSRLAQQLSNDLQMLTPARISVSSAGRSFPATLFASREPRVQVLVSSKDDANATEISLLWPGGEEPIWTGGISRSSARPVSDRSRVATQLANALLCLQRAFHGKLNRSSAQLYLGVCESTDRQPAIQRVSTLREVADANPKSAFAWAELSRAEAQLADVLQSNQLRASDAQTARELAQSHLKMAEALEPESTETELARMAVAELDEPRAWEKRLAIVDRAIARESNRAELYSRRAFKLLEVGRVRDALVDAKRAARLEPSSSEYRAQLIALLSYSDLHEAAVREIAEARRIWPDSRAIRNAEFFFNVRYGDATKADETGKAAGFSSVRMPVWEAYLKARQKPTSANIDRAVDLSRDVQQRDPSWTPQHLQLLGHFGRVETAYADLRRDSATLQNGTLDPTIFFRVHTRPLVYDRRFMEIAKTMGLLQFWRETGDWPDFCFAPGLLYDCKEEAAKLAS